MNLDLHKFGGKHYALALVFVVSTIGCGLCSIFLFDSDLFKSIDTFKLLLLSFAITAPLWLINSLVMMLVLDGDINSRDDDEEEIRNYGYWASLINIVAIGVPVLIRVYNTLEVKPAVTTALIVDVVALVGLYAWDRIDMWRYKKYLERQKLAENSSQPKDNKSKT